jgi:hypothetical protein
VAFEAAYFSEIMRAGISVDFSRASQCRSRHGHDLFAEHAADHPAAGISQHGADSPDADHHPVSGYPWLRHWRLRPAQGFSTAGKIYGRPEEAYLLAVVLCDVFWPVLPGQKNCEQIAIIR